MDVAAEEAAAYSVVAELASRLKGEGLTTEAEKLKEWQELLEGAAARARQEDAQGKPWFHGHATAPQLEQAALEAQEMPLQLRAQGKEAESQEVEKLAVMLVAAAEKKNNWFNDRPATTWASSSQQSEAAGDALHEAPADKADKAERKALGQQGLANLRDRVVGAAAVQHTLTEGREQQVAEQHAAVQQALKASGFELKPGEDALNAYCKEHILDVQGGMQWEVSGAIPVTQLLLVLFAFIVGGAQSMPFCTCILDQTNQR